MLWDTDETLSELFIDGEIRVLLPFSGRFLINSVEFTKIFRFSREFVEISLELNRPKTWHLCQEWGDRRILGPIFSWIWFETVNYKILRT